MNAKLTDRQLQKLKNAIKGKTRTTLRMNLTEMFDGNDLPYELY